MQGAGQQQNLIPGSSGTPYNAALLFQAQAGQMSGQMLAPRLALVPGGARPGAASLGPGTAAAAGAQYRPASVHMPGMGVMLKAPARKGPNQKGRKHCNCKNSRCLKLYCECFASGRYCDNCNCLSCHNNKESEAVRQAAVEAILERNPNAFRPKIQTAEGDTHPQSLRNAPDGSVRHSKGCNCKKSSCLKKYCECFQGGIFCTEICKCVDCKNYEGSEARAQVLSCHEPFNMQSLHQAAQAHAAMKRPRPQLTATVGSAGLLQAQNALQHLAAAAAAGGPNAPLMPLQQLQAMQAAAAAAQQQQQQHQQQQQQQAVPQPPSRPPLLDVVHDLVKPAVVEELCQLLILVAGEAADKQQQQQQGNHAANGTLPNGSDLQHEAAETAAVGDEPAKAAVAVVKVEHDADGDSVMQEASAPQQQHSSPAADAAADADEYSACYAAQEAVVLQEFNSILQRIIDQAERKGSVAAATAAAAAAAAACQDQAAAGAGAQASEQQQLQQLQQPTAVAQQMAMRPPVLSMPQQQAMAQQQAMMLQAASNNYALAQLQSRQAYLANAGGQQMAAYGGAGALGMQQMQQFQHMQQLLPGLRPMGMQQMVQVMAQDGSVHQIPAQSLMSLIPGAAQQQQQQQQQAAVSAAAAVPVAAPAGASAAASSSAPAAAGVGVSLLSLLNGAANNVSSAAAGVSGSS